MAEDRTAARAAVESVMGERGRLRSSHEMLKAALDNEQRGPDYVPFYIAVANFMEASMGRLDSQDIKMLTRLRDRLGHPSDEEEAIIAEVHRRLDGNREHLQKFLACRDALIDDGPEPTAIKHFEEVSDAYIDYIHNEMGHHAPSTDIARRIFETEDWLDIADLDSEYFAREQKLYTELMEKRPDCVPLGLAAEEYVEMYRSDKSIK
jgi:hypothetical protein